EVTVYLGAVEPNATFRGKPAPVLGIGGGPWLRFAQIDTAGDVGTGGGECIAVQIPERRTAAGQIAVDVTAVEAALAFRGEGGDEQEVALYDESIGEQNRFAPSRMLTGKVASGEVEVAANLCAVESQLAFDDQGNFGGILFFELLTNFDRALGRQPIGADVNHFARRNLKSNDFRIAEIDRFEFALDETRQRRDGRSVELEIAVDLGSFQLDFD